MAAVLASILLYPRAVLWGILVGCLGSACWIIVALTNDLTSLLLLNVAILATHLWNWWRA